MIAMDTQKILQQYEALFAPKTVAVVGASTKGTALPNVFIRRIREFGYEGAIYPIHPTAAEIDGLPAYKSLGETPQPVDYAYIAIAAIDVEAMRTMSPTPPSAMSQVNISAYGSLPAT